ncbi:UDP-glucuronic acid decarboxylase 4 [Galdieria sulphuraria]|nr:UDP-glucuronic acid decarboxylase 4 [Galdieria sulphuraria]
MPSSHVEPSLEPDPLNHDHLAKWRGYYAPNRPSHHKRILVTGGAGFIGSHLVDRLMEEGNEVIVVDSLFTGKKSNILRWLNNPKFEFVRHDVTLPYQAEVDQIYHLACPASPVHYKYNAIKTVKTNVLGTMNMLGLAKRVGARFLLASTSEVYGDPQVHPQSEEYWAETLTMDYSRQHGVEVRIVRIFNTYGPRMVENDGRVVSNFVTQALEGKPLTLYGDGKQTRSFCYVSDLVDGMIRMMNSEHAGPLNLVHMAATPDDPTRRQPDITKAKNLLNWQPKVRLRDGLSLMIEEFRERCNL